MIRSSDESAGQLQDMSIAYRRPTASVWRGRWRGRVMHQLKGAAACRSRSVAAWRAAVLVACSLLLAQPFPALADSLLPSFSDLVAKVAPAVVNVSTSRA